LTFLQGLPPFPPARRETDPSGILGQRPFPGEGAADLHLQLVRQFAGLLGSAHRFITLARGNPHDATPVQDETSVSIHLPDHSLENGTMKSLCLDQLLEVFQSLGKVAQIRRIGEWDGRRSITGLLQILGRPSLHTADLKGEFHAQVRTLLGREQLQLFKERHVFGGLLQAGDQPGFLLPREGEDAFLAQTDLPGLVP
jgi:hypothetical protein